jgi:hypothetical protein
MMQRGIVALIIGLFLGYWLGFGDANRGDATLGARVGRLAQRIHPDAVREAGAQRADSIRQTVRAQASVNP